MSSPALLDGIRILSLAEQYPGPYATMVLHDLGADVVMVERPQGGDPARAVPAFFAALNRGKRSVALDLKTAQGRAAYLHLAAQSDVVLDGFRPGTLDRLGVGYEEVRADNPRVVYVATSGFGQDGPYRGRPAHDASYQAIAGMLWERAESQLAGPSPSFQVGDLSGAMFTLAAVLAGLLQRERGVVGSYVDVAITDSLVSWMTTSLVPVLNGLGVPGFAQEPGYALYATSDGLLLSISIAHEDKFWRALCSTIGMDDVSDLSSQDRLDRYDELSARIAAKLLTGTREQWAARFAETEVPFGPVNRLTEVPRDAHLSSRGMFVTGASEPESDPMVYVVQPMQFRGYENVVPTRPPDLGEHTRDVLMASGIPPEEIDALLTAGHALQAA